MCSAREPAGGGARAGEGQRRGARVPAGRGFRTRLGAVRGHGQRGGRAVAPQAGGRDHRRPGIRGVHHPEQPETASQRRVRGERGGGGGGERSRRPRGRGDHHHPRGEAAGRHERVHVRFDSDCPGGWERAVPLSVGGNARVTRARDASGGDEVLETSRRSIRDYDEYENTPSHERRCGSSSRTHLCSVTITRRGRARARRGTPRERRRRRRQLRPSRRRTRLRPRTRASSARP